MIADFERRAKSAARRIGLRIADWFLVRGTRTAGRLCVGTPRRTLRVLGVRPSGAIALLLLACLTSTSVAQQPASPVAQPTEPLTETAIVERITAAVDRSLQYLADKQNPDGSWTENQAPNALTMLAFMGRGHVPGRGPFRETLQRGKTFILANQQPNGIFASTRPSHGPMYEHALATLACSEMYGMDPDPELEEKVRKAVNLIVAAQSPTGGWRYQPQPADADLSVTVMQIVALRAANNAEIPVPQPTIDKAIAYVRSCAHPSGGYAYQPGGGPNMQMAAAGVLSLKLLLDPEQGPDATVDQALAYMKQAPVAWDGAGVQYFYYFHYYAIQGHYQAGGQAWNDWHPRVRELLLSKQNADGSWDVPPGTAENDGTVGANKIYWSAMASLVLEIYMHFLPAYQR